MSAPGPALARKSLTFAYGDGSPLVCGVCGRICYRHYSDGDDTTIGECCAGPQQQDTRPSASPLRTAAVEDLCCAYGRMLLALVQADPNDSPVTLGHIRETRDILLRILKEVHHGA